MGIPIFEAHDGIGAETLAAAAVLCLTAVIIVSLRIYVRIKIGAFGRDDYSMIIALVSLCRISNPASVLHFSPLYPPATANSIVPPQAFFIPSCIVTILGCLSGFGAPEDVIDEIDPTGQMYKDGRKCKTG